MKVVNLAYFKDNKMLAVRHRGNQTILYAPGGQVEKGESDIQRLKREIKEELSVTVDIKSVQHLHNFYGQAHGKDEALELALYTGQLVGVLQPSSEIVEMQYINSLTDPNSLPAIAIEQILPWLMKQGLIG